MKIFISYSHKDDSLFQELVDGLAGVRFLIPPPSVWHDKLIPLASEWDEEIRTALNAADLVLLLVSRDFMKSQYIWEKEMTPALARHEAGQCKVLPIILRHTAAWEQSPFGKLQAAFRGKPVSGSPNKRDKAWKEIIEGVIALAERKTAAAVAAPPAGLHHLPIPRNPLFTGRDDDLQWIADTLAGGRPAALLHGMGGVGKTQTAAEYAHRHADQYKVAWWVAAQTGAEADAGYGALAEALRLPGYDPRDAEKTRQAVLAWMARESGWLVVLDNAEGPKDLAPWLPNTAKGHLLITSRNGNWANRAAVHDLDVWPVSQAADFLLTRSGDKDRAAAERLAAALGCLPLACETAAAYVAETGGSLARYAGLLAQQPVELLNILPEDTVYARSLPQVIHLATEAIERESPLAAEILRALAWLAPDNIPRWLLDAWAAEATAVDAALAALLRRALLRKSGDGFSVHRLTQQIIRAADPAPNDSAAAAIRLLDGALIGDPQYDVHLWPRYAGLLPHGTALFARLPDPPAELQAASSISTQLGVFMLFAKGDYPAARLWLERALGLTEVLVGPDHADLAVDLHNLGDLLRQMGDLTGAKPLLERALTIDEKTLGSDHPDVAYELAGLGIVHERLGELEEARRCHQRSLEIREGAYGPDHPLVATQLNNLASVLGKLGNQSAARLHYERGLKIHLTQPERGTDHPDTAANHYNLGAHLFAQGDATAAEPHMVRALEIIEKHLDPDHPHIAVARASLAAVRAALGKGDGGG